MTLHEKIHGILYKEGSLYDAMNEIIATVRENDSESWKNVVEVAKRAQHAKTIERVLAAVRKRIDPCPHSDTAYGVNIGLEMAEQAIKEVGDETNQH